ncbi:MAG: MBL fold metallo-hydrolase [Stenotrophobium sp.]
MALWKRLIGLRPPDARAYVAPAAIPARDGDALRIQYLGTAGFVISNAQRTLVLDPYLTRPGLFTSLTAPLVPDTKLIARLIPKADDVLIGHAHYDHILDGPDLCKQTGARLIGSGATLQVGLAAGLPRSQIVVTTGREDIASGAWTVRGLPSRHGKIFGRIPFPGDITNPPPWPPRMRDLRHGLVLNWLIDTGALKVMHIDSADFIDSELQGQRADIVCLCAIGRQSRPHYVRDVVNYLRPRWIIPCHWDTMITPVEDTPDLLPGVDLPGFVAEIEDAGVTPLLTPILGHQRFPCSGHSVSA